MNPCTACKVVLPQAAYRWVCGRGRYRVRCIACDNAADRKRQAARKVAGKRTYRPPYERALDEQLRDVQLRVWAHGCAVQGPLWVAV